MDIPDCWFFQNLRMAKGLADGGYLEPFLQKCGNYRVDDESSYELSWEGIASVFPNLRGYSNEEIEADILVLFDPLIDEFCRLCKLYEEKEGLPYGTSPLRVSVEREVYRNFDLYSYNYDYDFRFYHDGHGRGRMVVLMGCEFCGFEQLPTALSDVRNELEAQVRHLREKLAPKVLPKKKSKNKSKNVRKEAA